MKRKILLATTVTWPSAARLASAFSILGAEVEAVSPRHHILRLSRYLKHSYTYRPLSPLKSFEAALHAAEPDLVIPCDDRALHLLLQLTGFRPLLERSLGALENYPVLMGRAPSMIAAREEGIAAPLTVAVGDAAALPAALAEVGLPCVMKADASWGGEGVKFVCSAEDARRAFRALQGPPARWRSLARIALREDLHHLHQVMRPQTAAVCVQALIPGKPATSVFATRNGEVLAALHMDVAGWSGDTGPANLMQRVDDPAMETAARKVAARFRLNGLQGLDYVRDKQGVAHLIEINPRATQICHLALGPDLPAALLGVPPRPPVTTARQIALFPQLLTAGERSSFVYQDVPWDDPAVLSAASGELLPEAEVLDLIPQFERTVGGPAIFRSGVYGGPRR